MPFGDWPALRKNPALAGVTLPARLGAAGVQGPIVTKGALVFVGGGDTKLHAFDKTTGHEVWQAPLPGRAAGTPMTYRTRAGHQFIVIATGSGKDAALVAFGLGDARQPATIDSRR